MLFRPNHRSPSNREEVSANKAAWQLYKRLFTFAFKSFRCTRDDAFDMASYGICVGMEKDELNFGYCSEAVKNRILEVRRSRARRGEGSDLRKDYSGDGEHAPLQESRVRPNQEVFLVASECVRAIDSLSEPVRNVMHLAALEYNAFEMGNALNISHAEVRSRLQYGRRVLRERDGYELGRKRGHHQYIGIVKNARKWKAAIRHGETYYHLGQFATASEAAKAYDAKAKELLGAAATLNFPSNVNPPAKGTADV